MLVSSGSTVVDQAISARFAVGSVSALSYGGKSTALLLSVGATAVSAVALPHFSAAVAANDLRQIRKTLEAYVPAIFLSATLVTAVIIAFSEPLIALLFQRGTFTVEDTHLVSRVQVLCLLQVPTQLVTILGLRLLSALLMNRAIAVIALSNFALNAA